MHYKSIVSCNAPYNALYGLMNDCNYCYNTLFIYSLNKPLKSITH